MDKDKTKMESKSDCYIHVHELFFESYDNHPKFNKSYKDEGKKFLIDVDGSGKHLLANIKNATSK